MIFISIYLYLFLSIWLLFIYFVLIKLYFLRFSVAFFGVQLYSFYLVFLIGFNTLIKSDAYLVRYFNQLSAIKFAQRGQLCHFNVALILDIVVNVSYPFKTEPFRRIQVLSA